MAINNKVVLRTTLTAFVALTAWLSPVSAKALALHEFLLVANNGAGIHVPLIAIADQTTAAPDAAVAGPSINAARSFVDVMAKKTVAFLADKNLSEPRKKEQFRTLLFADFDLDTIGRFVLGPYWNRADPAQRQEYLRLFRDMIANVWAERFEQYQGQKFELRSARAADDRDTLVSSVIIPLDNPAVQVDWRVRYKNGQYKIVDVIVEGVSLSVTQRSDFSSVIQRGGGDVGVLLASLREQVK
jgi:phospholipid transport system substrate-binding protein